MSTQEFITTEATVSIDHCPVCDEELADAGRFGDDVDPNLVYRRHRRRHFTWGPDIQDDEDEYLEAYYEDENSSTSDTTSDGIESNETESETEPEEYTVVFHSEMRERVTVEAFSKAEAKREAREQRTYDGEITHTMHTDVETW